MKISHTDFVLQLRKFIAADLNLSPAFNKMPVGKWKRWQTEKYDPDQLVATVIGMTDPQVAVFCGEISGNLEIIDIDTKYQAGAGAAFCAHLLRINPGLFDKLFITSTVSGGQHILYKILDLPDDIPFPGNQKLALRPATIEELQLNPKEKNRCFIETRGTGGIAILPPSEGYTIFRNGGSGEDDTTINIPLITWDERCQLIMVAKSMSEIEEKIGFDMPKAYSNVPGNRTSDYYEIWPLDDFNARGNWLEIMQDDGWRVSSQNDQYTQIVRPGKAKGTGASFIHDRNLIYFFTTSTEFDAGKGYFPSGILIKLKFNGDGKAAHKWAESQGYGKLRPDVEDRIINKAVNQQARGLEPIIPENLSAKGKERVITETQAEMEAHPFGIFWFYNDEDSACMIDRMNLFHVINMLGIRLNMDETIRIKDQFLEKISFIEILELLINYTAEKEPATEIRNALDAFWEKHGKHTLSKCAELDQALLLKDTISDCYKLFRNGVVHISCESISLLGYDSYPDALFWRHLIIDRDYNPDFAIIDTEGPGKYMEYIKLACDTPGLALQAAAYLVHDFKAEENAYLIGLSEVCEDPKHGGGAGKNIFIEILRNVTSMVVVNGSQANISERFLQPWHGERILSLSDLPNKFDFRFIKEIVSGTATLKRLFKDEQSLHYSVTPKISFSTNYSIQIEDGGMKRRSIIIEFTDFFTREKGVDVYFRKQYPGTTGYFPSSASNEANNRSCWTQYDWDAFYFTIFSEIQKLINAGGKIKAQPLSAGGWAKQFIQMYSEMTYTFLSDNIEKWIANKYIGVDEFNEKYISFCVQNNISPVYRITAFRMNKALEDFCEHHMIKFVKKVQWKENGIKKFGRFFSRHMDEQPEESEENAPF